MLGIAAQFQGAHGQAVARLEECLALRRERGDEHGTVQPLGALGRAALLGATTRARGRCWRSRWRSSQRYDDRWSRAMSLTLLGHVELAEGEPGARGAARRGRGAVPRHRQPALHALVPGGAGGGGGARGEWERAARLCGARRSPARPARSPCRPPTRPDMSDAGQHPGGAREAGSRRHTRRGRDVAGGRTRRTAGDLNRRGGRGPTAHKVTQLSHGSHP